VLAPLAVLVGVYARVGALIIGVNMLFALWLAHASQLLSLNNTGGWAVELQGMFLGAALAIALIGPGRYSVNDR
jgi:putative oxidoreductase